MTRVFLASVILLATVVHAAASDRPPLMVSMIELIANRDKYDGKLVQVSGFISIAFEDNALYLDENAHAHTFTENAIWINFDPKDRIAFERVNQRYGYIAGVFRHDDCNGHLCLYAGQLNSSRVGLTFKTGKGTATK